jgi:hypothetical protein
MMLPLPERGLRRSVKKHNSDWSILLDWVQGSALFGRQPVSKTNVVDALCDGAIYVPREAEDPADDEASTATTKQELVYQAADIIWAQIEARHRWLGPCSPFLISASALEAPIDWRQAPAYSFCLILALVHHYHSLSLDPPAAADGAAAAGFVDQGELFELLSAASLEAHGWEVKRIGWAPDRTVTFADAVSDVAEFMHETDRINDKLIELYKEKKEMGLDLVCCRRFCDLRPGIPYFLIQCASGADWPDKTHTPDLELWREVIPFAAAPRRGFAIPFGFGDETDFYKGAKRTHGVLLDRYRIMSVGKAEAEWVPSGLREKLLQWLEPRIDKVLKYDPS